MYRLVAQVKALTLEVRRQRIQPVAHHDNGMVEFGTADGMQHGVLSLDQTSLPWHCLYFLPLPHGHGSLRTTFGNALRTGCAPSSDSDWARASS
ncbi:hypothetical protein G6F57_023519 [Rhizopus arrhizus]|nr:hypothetical protein G6F57_023519 [Rhizopus arrhizus]